MKRVIVRIALALMVLSMPSLASAQVPEGIRGGIKGGITFGDIPEFAEVLDAGAADTAMRMGFTIGGFGYLSFDDMFGLQLEALYTQKGIGYEIDADEFQLRVDYIELPVLFRMQTARAGGVYGLVGPAFGFNVKAETFSEIGEEETSVDVGDDISGLEISFVAAVGYQMRNFLVEGRYMEGLTNIIDQGDVDLITYKTRSFAILAGFRF